MDSFDINLLFKNIFLQETTDLSVNILYQGETCIDVLTKEHF